MAIDIRMKQLKELLNAADLESYLKASEFDILELRLESTRSAAATMSVVYNDRTVYLHSRYDPLQEAEKLMDKYVNIEEYDHIVFYGLGLGYHIELFTRRYPHVHFSIYEPFTAILDKYLLNDPSFKVRSNMLQNIYIDDDNGGISNNFMDFIYHYKGNVLVIALPSYESAFSDKYGRFYQEYGSLFDTSSIALKTRKVFEKLWTVNVIKNFGDMLDTPNILAMNKDDFVGKPAVLVSAGPSLDDEIENLRYIKEKGLAYIFSAGSAISTLTENNILPDAAVLIDPQQNLNVIKKVIDRNISTIPLVFGTSVGYNILEAYTGPKLHFTTNKDSISPFYLRHSDKEDIKTVADGGSVAIAALDLLNKLGCSPLILVGQNLAYRDNRSYSNGIDYSGYGVNNKQSTDLKYFFSVPSVNGGKVFTSKVLNNFRMDMEELILSNNIRCVINTTKDGAKISGTEYMPLEIVIQEFLKQKVVNEYWYKAEYMPYDKLFLKSQSKGMDAEYRKLLDYDESMRRCLRRMLYIRENNYGSDYSEVFSDFLGSYKSLTMNSFFKVFIYSMNSYHCGLLANKIKRSKNELEKNAFMNKLAEDFMEFLDESFEDIQKLQPLLDIMNGKIMKL